MEEFQAAQKKVEELDKPLGKGLDAGQVDEPVIFGVPKTNGPVATGIRSKVEDMEKEEQLKKEQKEKAEEETLKEAIGFAGHVGVDQ